MEMLYLSKRNLQTLLNKLERAEKGEATHCTIIKHHNPNDPYINTSSVMVVALPDEVLYANRQAGAMHPADDPAIKAVKER
jgi:hypothetical protein